jgi:c-di-GMP phosphodiesterase
MYQECDRCPPATAENGCAAHQLRESYPDNRRDDARRTGSMTQQKQALSNAAAGPPTDPPPAPHKVPELALVARQAIYNPAKEVIAYELLYRRSENASKAEIIDGRLASLEVITHSVLEIGLDKLAGEQPIHINYPSELLAANLIAPVPANRVVIEVLEGVRAEPAVVAGIKAMRARGHHIALDDFSPGVSDAKLLEVADTVKLDVSDYTPESLEKMVRVLKARRLRLIAERIETVEEFDRCVRLGFDGFQGYFLQHPRVFSARPVPSSRLGTLRLVAVLQSDDAAVDAIERMIAQDVSLSYRVLRCINSSYYGFAKKIDSIRQAVVILGFEKLRQLCALIALREVEDRPASVFVDAMTRARMCEKVGALRGSRDTSSLFITGLFSTLDALTGIPMAELLKELPLSDSVSKALKARQGELGAVLSEVIEYERGTWTADEFPGITSDLMQTTYLEAIAWAEATQALVSS